MDAFYTGAAAADERPSSARAQVQIQGPRPPPLSIHKESHKIKKPPRHPQHAAGPQQPVIIYAVSPKVVNVAVSDFMTTVQRLTGVSSDDFSSGGDVSPAARLASTEKVVNSPKEKSGRSTYAAAIDELVGEGLEVGCIPGILSPATLPPVMQDMYFSPVTDPLGSSGLLASPGLFSGALGSPILSPDIFGQIWNF